MLPRLLPLLACLSVTLPIQAAPAPLRRAEPARPEVLLRGFLREDRLPVGEPVAVGNQADYQALARAWGIAEPPRVDFRTHFLAVHLAPPFNHIVRFEVDDRGDVRPVTQSTAHMFGYEVAGHRFLIQSFRRSAVKTVNGLPLPK
jgi:hypothetical protein